MSVEYREGPEESFYPIKQSSQESYIDFGGGIITSKNIEKIAEALSSAQSEMGHALKDSQNPFFKSTYADLSQVIDVVRPCLSKNAISFIQFPFFDGVTVTVTTRLMHKSGQYLQNQFRLKPKAIDPQSVGSAITYARRYSLSSICGVTQDDDDGNRCSAKREGDQEKITLSEYEKKKTSQGGVKQPATKTERFPSRQDQISQTDHLFKKLLEKLNISEKSAEEYIKTLFSTQEDDRSILQQCYDIKNRAINNAERFRDNFLYFQSRTSDMIDKKIAN